MTFQICIFTGQLRSKHVKNCLLQNGFLECTSTLSAKPGRITLKCTNEQKTFIMQDEGLRKSWFWIRNSSMSPTLNSVEMTPDEQENLLNDKCKTDQLSFCSGNLEELFKNGGAPFAEMFKVRQTFSVEETDFECGDYWVKVLEVFERTFLIIANEYLLNENICKEFVNFVFPGENVVFSKSSYGNGASQLFELMENIGTLR